MIVMRLLVLCLSNSVYMLTAAGLLGRVFQVLYVYNHIIFKKGYFSFFLVEIPKLVSYLVI